MKKITILFVSALLLFGLIACETVPNPSDSARPSDTPSPTDNTESILFEGKIVDVRDDTLLIAADSGEAGQLLTLSIDGLDVIDAYGNAGYPTDFRTGTHVAITYDGTILETYPMQLSNPTAIQVRDRSDDLVPFYLTVIRDLLEVDPGLNEDISVLALDLRALTNLTDAETSALLYLSDREFGAEARFADFDTLVAEGLIVDSYFETGILVRFTEMEETDEGFTFSVDKYRSGLGAYFFVDCTAVRGDGGIFFYTIGSEAIS
ncbi:YobA family protein [Oscillospiraceae bacterium OttesenSCG-928-G22]|nr:YobA family protein [Oscillospiraceae bacterium OttesenSCG-928-G22]